MTFEHPTTTEMRVWSRVIQINHGCGCQSNARFSPCHPMKPHETASWLSYSMKIFSPFLLTAFPFSPASVATSLMYCRVRKTSWNRVSFQITDSSGVSCRLRYMLRGQQKCLVKKTQTAVLCHHIQQQQQLIHSTGQTNCPLNQLATNTQNRQRGKHAQQNVYCFGASKLFTHRVRPQKVSISKEVQLFGEGQ